MLYFYLNALRSNVTCFCCFRNSFREKLCVRFVLVLNCMTTESQCLSEKLYTVLEFFSILLVGGNRHISTKLYHFFVGHLNFPIF